LAPVGDQIRPFFKDPPYGFIDQLRRYSLNQRVPNQGFLRKISPSEVSVPVNTVRIGEEYGAKPLANMCSRYAPLGTNALKGASQRLLEKLLKIVPEAIEFTPPCGTTDTVALDQSLMVDTSVPDREPKLVRAVVWTMRIPVGLRL
jgi:hypothetical protein